MSPSSMVSFMLPVFALRNSISWLMSRCILRVLRVRVSRAFLDEPSLLFSFATALWMMASGVRNSCEMWVKNSMRKFDICFSISICWFRLKFLSHER